MFERRARRGISPPELRAGAYRGMQRLGLTLQVAAALAIALLVLVLPGVDDRDRIRVALFSIGYAVYALVGDAVVRHWPALRPVSFATDLVALFGFAFAMPEIRVAVMFAAVAIVVFHAYASGRTLGFTLAAGSFVLAVLADATAPDDGRLDTFTLAAYGVILVVITMMVDGLSAERRRQASRLSRLHHAVEQLTPAPDLEAMLESIARAATDAVDATLSVVLLRERDHLSARATTDTLNQRGVEVEMTRAALEDPDTSPSATALATGRPVVVDDFSTDERFGRWAETAAHYGFGSMVSVPLFVGAEAIGVVNSYSGRAGAFDADDVDLLVAYARQASLALARALAFEREKQAASQLAEADRMKREFVTTVSHELRTPLTSIYGFVETLLRHWERLDDAQRREMLERAAWNTTELRRLIEQILAFARSDAVDEPLSLGTCALREEIASILDHMAPVIGDHLLALDIDPGIQAVADPQALHHVIWNLVSNAAKYSAEGSRIEIRATTDGEQVTVEVRDEGPGISPADRDRVFERFWRGEATSRVRGTGIGLAVVRSFVERMGGRAWVDSEPGAGATFSFTLPAADRVPAPRPVER